jgi:SPP1 family phage portal protein
MLDNLAIYQYSQSSIETDGLIKTEYFADVFTDTEIITYKALTVDGEYTPTGDRQEHGFQRLPVVKFQNNPELRGDFEGALELIDAYDRILSDVDNELEQFRLAYLALSGVGRLEQDDIDALKQTGVFSFEQVGGKAEFIVKNINKEVIEFMLKKLEQNILHFSQTPNFREESFAGQQSGVALEFKFRPFEFNCVKTEREVSAGLRNQYRVIADYVNILDTTLNFNYLDMEFMFTRNLPTNTLEEAQIQATLKGLITDKTRISLFSKIGDAEDELQAMTEEGVSINNFTGLNNEP